MVPHDLILSGPSCLASVTRQADGRSSLPDLSGFQGEGWSGLSGIARLVPIVQWFDGSGTGSDIERLNLEPSGRLLLCLGLTTHQLAKRGADVLCGRCLM